VDSPRALGAMRVELFSGQTLPSAAVFELSWCRLLR